MRAADNVFVVVVQINQISGNYLRAINFKFFKLFSYIFRRRHFFSGMLGAKGSCVCL